MTVLPVARRDEVKRTLAACASERRVPAAKRPVGADAATITSR